MLQSCLTKHLLKADILFRGEFEIMPVDSGICRCRVSDPLFRGCHQSGSFSSVTRERHPASQSEHLCRTKRSLSDKGTPRSHLAMGKIRSRKFLPMVSEVLLDGSCGRDGSGCNITTVRYEKKVRRTDWSGRERTVERLDTDSRYAASGGMGEMARSLFWKRVKAADQTFSSDDPYIEIRYPEWIRIHKNRNISLH